MVKVNRLGIHRRRCCKTHFPKSVAVAAHNGGVLLRLLSRCYVRGLVALGLLGLATPRCFCQWQPSSILCNAGSGKFDAESPTHVAVHIAATKQGSLSMRSCTATLNWGNQSLIVATAAAQVDLDVFAGDFGDAVPVTAFLIKQADSDCCMQYAIYSLKKPPRLLRTIAGGEFFSASDIDLDGNVEIFTEDAFAVRDFDHITLGEMDLAPPLVLRFVHSHLQDVSAEFQPYFDRCISELRAAVSARELEEFKNSNGALAKMGPGTSAQDLHRLRSAKIKVLEIVWTYLYSGRENEAWKALAEMWPARDIDRIRSALLAVRARGIRSQIDGTITAPTKAKKRRTQILNAIALPEPGGALDATPPRAILLQRPMILQQDEQEVLLELILDKAGKVRSAEMPGSAKKVNGDLLNAALNWKFIPALRGGRPVASRFRIAVSGKQ